MRFWGRYFLLFAPAMGKQASCINLNRRSKTAAASNRAKRSIRNQAWSSIKPEDGMAGKHLFVL